MNRQQKGWQQLFLFSLLPLFLAIFGASGWLWWNWAISPAQLNSAKPQQIQIPPGTATQQIGTKLEQAGLIRSKIAWNLLARSFSSQKSNGGFQAGTYELSANQPLNACF